MTYGELHALGTSSPQLAADDNLATLSTALHDEPQNTIAGSSNGKTVQELVSERLALSDGGQTTVLDLSGIEGDGVLGELEALLDEGSELADATALLAQDFLCVCGPDDDVGNGGSNADLDAGVALLSEFALEEFVEFGVEHTVCEAGLASFYIILDIETAMCGLSQLPKSRETLNVGLEATGSFRRICNS